MLVEVLKLQLRTDDVIECVGNLWGVHGVLRGSAALNRVLLDQCAHGQLRLLT